MLDGGKLYFGCGTFKNVYKQLTKNPKAEIVAAVGGEFIRYDGRVKTVKDEALIRDKMPQIMAMYDKSCAQSGLMKH